MVELGKNALDKIPLDQDLRDAIELAQKIKKKAVVASFSLSENAASARRRSDPPGTGQAEKPPQPAVAFFHKLEQIRDRLIEQGDGAYRKC